MLYLELISWSFKSTKFKNFFQNRCIINARSRSHRKRLVSRSFYRFLLDSDFTPLCLFFGTISSLLISCGIRIRRIFSLVFQLHPFFSRFSFSLFYDRVARNLNNFANLIRARFSLATKLYTPHDPRVSCVSGLVRSRVNGFFARKREMNVSLATGSD